MLYTPTNSYGNNAECVISGIELPEPGSMSRQALNAELEHISIAVNERMDGLSDNCVTTSPEFSRWATECELSRLHDLKMAFPSHGQLRVEAKARLKLRLAERTRRRLTSRDTQISLFA